MESREATARCVAVGEAPETKGVAVAGCSAVDIPNGEGKLTWHKKKLLYSL